MSAKSEEALKKQYESQKRIHAATLERIVVDVKKGNKKRYQDHAKNKGMSLTSLIVNLLEEDIKK